MWKQVGPGENERQDSSSEVSVPRRSYNQSRSETTSLIAEAEALSKQMSSFQNTEVSQQPFSGLNATAKELSVEFQDLKKSTLERLEDSEYRLENMQQGCDRVEKPVSDEQRRLNISFKKLQEEFRDASMKLKKRFEDVEGNMRSLVKKEIEDQRQRGHLQQNKLQVSTLTGICRVYGSWSKTK